MKDGMKGWATLLRQMRIRFTLSSFYHRNHVITTVCVSCEVNWEERGVISVLDNNLII